MLGYKSPILAQSMYIFKNAKVGGEVGPHTDNTYIRTTPSSCVGIWVAFDDATKDNGCMWGYPDSQKTPTNYFMKLRREENGKLKTFYEPSEQQIYDLKTPIPFEAEKGTVVLLHGDFLHYSMANTSDMQRHAYTLHMVESRDHVWDSDNWIQRKENPFRFLYENVPKEIRH